MQSWVAFFCLFLSFFLFFQAVFFFCCCSKTSFSSYSCHSSETQCWKLTQFLCVHVVEVRLFINKLLWQETLSNLTPPFLMKQQKASTFIYVIWKLWVSSFFLSTKTLSGDEPVAAAAANDDKFASSVSNKGWLSWFKGTFSRSEIANRNKINLFSDVKLKMSTRFVSQMQ